MNSFTHTGYQHLVRRHAEGEFGPVNYPDQEIVQSLELAGIFVLLSATELAILADNEHLSQDVSVKMRSYLG